MTQRFSVIDCRQCPPKGEPEGKPGWRCPACGSRYLYERRKLVDGFEAAWRRLPDDQTTDRVRVDALMRRSQRRVILWGVFATLVAVAVVVWAVLYLGGST